MVDSSILVAGETLVDLLPGSSDPLADVETFTRRPGGAPANVSVRLAQLGHPPLFWTRVGTDPFGEFLAETLDTYGVPDRFVERDATAKTTLAFVSESDADDGFTFYRDGTADTRLRPGTVPRDTLSSVDWVAVGGVALSTEPARGAIFDLVERARDAGSSVLLDPNVRPELWSDGEYRREIRRMLTYTDVVTAAREDLTAAGFTGETALELARETAAAGPNAVFVTAGRDGASAFASEGSRWDAGTAIHDGFSVDSVDVTGAGDAFTAGILAGALEGERSLCDALEGANRVAAASTLTAGGIGPLDVDAVSSE